MHGQRYHHADKSTREHHALHGDIDDATAFRNHTAQGRENEQRGKFQRRMQGISGNQGAQEDLPEHDYCSFPGLALPYSSCVSPPFSFCSSAPLFPLFSWSPSSPLGISGKTKAGCPSELGTSTAERLDRIQEGRWRRITGMNSAAMKNSTRASMISTRLGSTCAMARISVVPERRPPRK